MQRRLQAFQDGVDAGHQLARAEGLGHIVVATDLETDDAVDLFVPRRQEQDRDFGGLAQLAADLQPVELRHIDVEHDQIRAFACEQRQSLGAVPRDAGLQPRLVEREVNDVPDVRIVIHDQYLARHDRFPGAEPFTVASNVWL